ncbi:MAG TPA: helix-turn-helix domain-containing protein [Thermoleophilaceae bacterium]
MAEPTESPVSPLSEALASVGDRWTLLIVAALLDGPRRFGDLEKELPGIAPNVLTQRLRNLESQGLVRAERYSERPPRFVYELAESGRELAGALRLLADWGARHTGDVDAPRHSVCGTPLEAVWYCPTCETPVEDEGAEEDVHYA